MSVVWDVLTKLICIIPNLYSLINFNHNANISISKHMDFCRMFDYYCSMLKITMKLLLFHQIRVYSSRLVIFRIFQTHFIMMTCHLSFISGIFCQSPSLACLRIAYTDIKYLLKIIMESMTTKHALLKEDQIINNNTIKWIGLQINST